RQCGNGRESGSWPGPPVMGGACVPAGLMGPVLAGPGAKRASPAAGCLAATGGARRAFGTGADGEDAGHGGRPGTEGKGGKGKGGAAGAAPPFGITDPSAGGAGPRSPP